MKQYVYLKSGLEKTGDSIKSNSRLKAAKYFADKKRIPLKLWLNIYTVLPDGNFKTDKTYRFENRTTTLYYGYKVSINKIVLLKSIEKKS